MQSPIKLAGAAILVATTSFAQLTQQEMDLIRLAIGQPIERSDPNVHHYYEPDPVEPIRQAYPNNPQLYRYLERNPRYIDYYLGR